MCVCVCVGERCKESVLCVLVCWKWRWEQDERITWEENIKMCAEGGDGCGEGCGVGTGSERGHSIILYILRPSYKRR